MVRRREFATWLSLGALGSVLPLGATAEARRKRPRRRLRQCDLVINALHWSDDFGNTWHNEAVSQDASVLFQAIIQNVGNAASPPELITVEFQVDGEVASWAEHEGGISAGDSITLKASGGPQGDEFWVPTAAGDHTLRALVDSGERVAESNESNNTRTATIQVEATTPVAVANGNDASTPFETPVKIDVLANDVAPAGYALVVAAVQSPTEQGGTAVITPDRKFVEYAPPSGFSGDDFFSYDNGIVPA